MDIFGMTGGSGCGGCGGRCGWYIWHRSDSGDTKLQIGNCNAANNYGQGEIPDYNKAHLWGFTRSGNTVKFYVDGKLNDTQTMGGDFGSVGVKPLKIGDVLEDPTELGATLGVVFIIYNVELTTDEMASMWHSFNQGDVMEMDQ